MMCYGKCPHERYDGSCPFPYGQEECPPDLEEQLYLETKPLEFVLSQLRSLLIELDDARRRAELPCVKELAEDTAELLTAEIDDLEYKIKELRP